MDYQFELAMIKDIFIRMVGALLHYLHLDCCRNESFIEGFTDPGTRNGLKIRSQSSFRLYLPYHVAFDLESLACVSLYYYFIIPSVSSKTFSC